MRIVCKEGVLSNGDKKNWLKIEAGCGQVGVAVVVEVALFLCPLDRVDFGK